MTETIGHSFEAPKWSKNSADETTLSFSNNLYRATIMPYYDNTTNRFAFKGYFFANNSNSYLATVLRVDTQEVARAWAEEKMGKYMALYVNMCQKVVEEFSKKQLEKGMSL